MKTGGLATRRGFTLLEVLIALTILAISSMAVITQTGQSLNQLAQLRLKTVAMVIAENQINRARITEQWPATGRSTDILSAQDQSWVVNMEVTATSEPWLRKMTVTVSLHEDGDEFPLASLVAYRGLH